MISRSIGVLVTVLALAAPLTCAAQSSFEFDRNENGTVDMRFSGDQSTRPIVQFDNDEDGRYDFGFQGGCNAGDGVICAMWIDRNGNGKVQKNEVRMLPLTLPWATFPSSYNHTSEPNGGSITHFMDYTDDDALMTAREVGLDLTGDGDLEEDKFLAAGAIGEGMADVCALMDTNDDGFFDRLSLLPEIGDEVVIGFTKALQKQLPALDDYNHPL